MPTASKPSQKPRKHICDVCSKAFTTATLLKAHIRIHTGERPFVCDICNRTFNQNGPLLVHMRIHTGKRPYSCTYCEKSFTQNSALKSHLRTHTGERPYDCILCEKSFATRPAMHSHMRTHCTDKKIPLNCPVCEKQLVCKVALRDHMRDIHEMFPQESCTCPECDKSFLNRRRLIRHMKTHTIRERAFSCKVCDKTFLTRSGLKNHKAVHTESQSFSCRFCCKQFAGKQFCDRHEKNHLIPTSNNFSCPSCNKQFRYKKSLQIHLKKKPVVKHPRVCIICSKSFAQMSQLELHVRTHFPPKRTCSQCSESFDRQFELLCHMKLHKKKQNTKCSACSERFINPESLKDHISVYHSESHPFPCETCFRVYPTAASYQQHIRNTHDLQLLCSVCGMRFPKGRLARYKAHVEKHKNVPDTVVSVMSELLQRRKEMGQCSACSLVFDDVVALKHHISSHSREYPLQCHFCYELFSTEAEKKLHSNIHPTVNNWFENRCKKSGKTFPGAIGLKEHDIEVHQKNKACCGLPSGNKKLLKIGCKVEQKESDDSSVGSDLQQE